MIVADALLIAGDAKTPAKNLQIVNETILCDKAAPRMKMANKGVVVRNTTLRPEVSLNGAPTRGPKAKPRL